MYFLNGTETPGLVKDKISCPTRRAQGLTPVQHLLWALLARWLLQSWPRHHLRVQPQSPAQCLRL
jgi:hypothetical protein